MLIRLRFGNKSCPRVRPIAPPTVCTNRTTDRATHYNSKTRGDCRSSSRQSQRSAPRMCKLLRRLNQARLLHKKRLTRFLLSSKHMGDAAKCCTAYTSEHGLSNVFFRHRASRKSCVEKSCNYSQCAASRHEDNRSHAIRLYRIRWRMSRFKVLVSSMKSLHYA